jgi:hypothetical protein
VVEGDALDADVHVLPERRRGASGQPSARGRPSKLTPAREERILAALRAGNYLETAGRLAGISSSTLHKWRSEFPEFSEAVDAARAEAEAAMVSEVRTASVKHWQAAAWWLERSFPRRWGRSDRREEEDSPPALEEAKDPIYRFPTRDRVRDLLELAREMDQKLQRP